jgi:hypothetical protein
MAGVTGRESKIAFAKYGTNSWGVAASVTKGMYFANDGGLKFKPSLIEDESFGQIYTGEPEYGDIDAVEGGLQAQTRFDDNAYILEALAMGSPATVTISSSVTGATTSWRHQIDLSDSLQGLGVTLAIDKKLYVDELTSAKVFGFEEECGSSGKATTTFKLKGSKLTNISSVNTNSTVAGATFPALGNRVMLKHAVLRMNKAVGTSLTATDAVQFESVKYGFTRPVDNIVVGGSDFIIEPEEDGTAPVFTLEVNYPRMNTVSANSLIAALRDNTTWKADLTYTGTAINSADSYTRKFEFSALKTDGHVTAVSNRGQIKPKATFRAYMATTTPTNMTFIRPMRLTRIMVNSVIAF